MTTWSGTQSQATSVTSEGDTPSSAFSRGSDHRHACSTAGTQEEGDQMLSPQRSLPRLPECGLKCVTVYRRDLP